MRASFGGATHTGRVRQRNEDAFRIDCTQQLLVVCDGMGGHSKGDVASALVVETLAELLTPGHEQTLAAAMPPDPGLLPEMSAAVAAVRLANQRIYSTALAQAGSQGMGTTVAVLGFTPSGTFYGAGVGDSRVYRYRHSRLECLTRDHTYLNDLLDSGEITPAAAEGFAHKNVLSRALGVGSAVKVDVFAGTARAGDIYLVCTDGLHGLVSDSSIAGILAADNTDPDGLAGALIAEAHRCGGHDNITAAVAVIDEAPEPPGELWLFSAISDDSARYGRRGRELGRLFPQPRRHAGAAVWPVVALAGLALAGALVWRLFGARFVREHRRVGRVKFEVVPAELADSARLWLDDTAVQGLETRALAHGSRHRVRISVPGYLPDSHDIEIRDTLLLIPHVAVPEVEVRAYFVRVTPRTVRFLVRRGHSGWQHRPAPLGSMPCTLALRADTYQFRVFFDGRHYLSPEVVISPGRIVELVPDEGRMAVTDRFQQ